MLRIVTDGAADILPERGSAYGIDVIPVNIVIGELSISIAANPGPGTVGLILYPTELGM
jgi:fatty acid-binding protein DegV